MLQRRENFATGFFGVAVTFTSGQIITTGQTCRIFHFLARRWVICPFRSAFFFFRFYVRGRHRQSAGTSPATGAASVWLQTGDVYEIQCVSAKGHMLESTQGCVLEIRAPRLLLQRKASHTPTESDRGLLSNAKIRSKGSSGYLRWVVAGENTELPVRITGVMIPQFLPSSHLKWW